ncbi:MAG: heavy metal translocating P-type ATPase [Prevotella sp.]|nr:heavy metal translocating P-type ATPase [Prevotella sp.]
MKKTIPVVGMACSACSAHVEKRLSEMEGVHSASVSLTGRSATVEYDETIVSLSQMKQAVNDIGFDLVIESNRSIAEIERRNYTLLLRKTLLSWCFSILVMMLSMGWGTWLFGDVLQSSNSSVLQLSLLFALANMLFCGRDFYVNAFKQLRHGVASMDVLVAMSTMVAFLFSTFNTFWGDAVWTPRGIEWHTYFDASCMIITFVLTGRLLEEKAKNATAGSIRELMGLQPKTARLVPSIQPQGGGMAEPSLVPLTTITIGDVLEVRAGEKVPVDGIVVEATSFMTADSAYVDEAMISGEPTPVRKSKGDKVLSGTVLQQGTLHVRARQVGEQSALANIIRMVQEAQSSKAPVQRIVDKIAMVFVPVVLCLSLLTLVAWIIIGSTFNVLPHAILSAIAVLVIACPCAMGLATPTALMVSIGKAAKNNILVKDATALERLKDIQAMVIDKTGTLTIPNQQIDFTRADSLPLEEREQLKPHAREAMTTLISMGVDVYMMSGDRDDAARYWAEKAGIRHYHSMVKPQDKENLVRQLQQEGKVVAMVGDGINDTQALALADVSIAMGRGTDVAMDVAQVTLMSDDLRRLPESIRLSRRTVSMIRQNLFWAFIYNLVSIPLAAGIPYAFGIHWQITPMWASALMACSSVSVVLNSLRLKFISL